MNADEAREQATHALANRLRAWGVSDAEVRARDYIAGLYVNGWRWQAPENRPVPPRRADECEIHDGQWANRCAGCAADAKAADEPPAPASRRRETTPKPPLRELLAAATPTTTTDPRTKEVPQ